MTLTKVYLVSIPTQMLGVGEITFPELFGFMGKLPLMGEFS